MAEQADTAAKAGDFEKAARLYGEHLAVVPEDADVKIKYADTLTKGSTSLKKQTAALQLYAEVLRQYPGREDARRRQMELKFAMGLLRDSGAEADLQMLLSLPQNETDGNLMYLLARCREEGKNYQDARKWYESAIKHDATRKIEASERLAAPSGSPTG